jgi:hypothetical protein
LATCACAFEAVGAVLACARRRSCCGQRWWPRRGPFVWWTRWRAPRSWTAGATRGCPPAAPRPRTPPSWRTAAAGYCCTTPRRVGTMRARALCRCCTRCTCRSGRSGHGDTCGRTALCPGDVSARVAQAALLAVRAVRACACVSCPQDLGQRFVRSFYGADTWLQGLAGRPTGPFLVLDQCHPNYQEQLFRCVTVWGLVFPD